MNMMKYVVESISVLTEKKMYNRPSKLYSQSPVLAI